VNKKNNCYEITRVFMEVKVWLKRSLGQSEEGEMERGHVHIEERPVDGNSHK